MISTLFTLYTFNSYYSNVFPALNFIPLYLRFINTIQIQKMDKNQGTVKFFNSEKGFGFIKHDDSDKETFVHVSGLVNDIKEGDKVEFELQNGKKGMNAVNVTVIG
jgi:CspA family cold shock protein